MCPNNRTDILNIVRGHLKANERVICISTQLSEAGVDISFECVIRSLAGLDSIAQAAGRCNRHGEAESRSVYVIDYVEENLRHLAEISKGKEIAKLMLMDLRKDSNAHGASILSMKAMNYYFKALFQAFDVDLDYLINWVHLSINDLFMTEDKESSIYKDYRLYNTT